MLPEIADRILEACRISLDGMGTIPAITVITDAGGHEKWSVHRFTGRESKWEHFDALAEIARIERPRSIAFGGDCRLTLVPPERVKHLSDAERHHVFSQTPEWLVSHGYGTSGEAIDITVQSAETAYFLTVPYRRRRDGSIDWGEPRHKLLPQSAVPLSENAIRFFRTELRDRTAVETDECKSRKSVPVP
jgi:hypothetical protein